MLLARHEVDQLPGLIRWPMLLAYAQHMRHICIIYHHMQCCTRITRLNCDMMGKQWKTELETVIMIPWRIHWGFSPTQHRPRIVQAKASPELPRRTCFEYLWIALMIFDIWTPQLQSSCKFASSAAAVARAPLFLTPGRSSNFGSSVCLSC